MILSQRIISGIVVRGFLGSALLLVSLASAINAQTLFPLGEKLTYQLALGRFADAGFAEMSVVSQGRMSGRNVVEIRTALKTRELVSAFFLMTDETRAVYADPETGMPLYILATDRSQAIPKESAQNFFTQPAAAFDLVTMIYKARQNLGNGTLTFFEGDRVISASFVSGGNERVKTNAGEYDTVVSNVTSDWLTESGLRDVKVNFSTDEDRVPVLFRFKSTFGDGQLRLSGHIKPRRDTPIEPQPTPTPQIARTPTPPVRPTPEPYQPNKPLLPELGFQLGEITQYRLTKGGQFVATVTVSARERKLFQNLDSLLLSAEFGNVVAGQSDLAQGDLFTSQVDPDTLAPRWIDAKFRAIPIITRTALFDPLTGSISVSGAKPVDGPMGTHTLLSLMYAMRSFNLKPNRDPSNPVNDTRVAVFWDDRAHVFTLRPSNPEDIMIAGGRVSAQMIAVSTGIPVLDSLSIKVWLSNEPGRTPVRITFGQYAAEIVPSTTDLDQKLR